MRPTSETDNVHDRHSGYPEANDPSPSPWAEAPAQREPDHDGQLYVGAAHPDTEVTPEEAEAALLTHGCMQCKARQPYTVEALVNGNPPDA